MGISAASIGEIRATGSTTNGGYYDGTIANAEDDMTQQDSGVAFTFTSIGAGNVIAITSGNASDLKIGNGVCITGGTNVTQGFYQITARSGNDITLSTNKAGGSVSTLAAISGTGNAGGAFKLGATTSNRSDDDFLEAVSNSGGSTIHVKGSHTTASAISLSATGTGAVKHRFKGYGTTRNDSPSIASGNQPLINYSTLALTFGTNWELIDCRFTGTSAAGVAFGAVGKAVNCEFINTSGTANRASVTHGNSAVNFIGCKFSSTSGYAVVGPNTNGGMFLNCYFHDSVSGYRPSAASGGILTFLRCIFDNISTAALDFSVGAPTGQHHIINCTFYGAETPAGTAYSIASSSTAIHTFLNNIVYGWTNGVNSGSAVAEISDFNIFNNCTTARTNWSTGSNDLTSNPNFVDAPNGNFQIGTNAQRVGYPSSIPNGLTTQIMNIGAVNSDYSSWYTDIPVSKVLTSQGNFKYNSLSNNRTPTYDDTNLTNANVKTGVSFGVSGSGTYDGSDRWTDPGESNVRFGTAYKANSTSNNKTGTAKIPTAANTKIGVAVDVSDTGTYDGSDRWTDPGEANVRSGTAYKANSGTNNKTGTAAIPVAANVRLGTATDATTGTLAVPSASDVRFGVSVDAGTGTAKIPTAVNTKIGIAVDVSDTGTYDGSDRHTDPGEANVRSGVVYKSNSATNNKTGTAVIPSAADVREGTNVDATQGSLAVPDREDVRFGVDVDATTGLAKIPTEANVKHGVDVDVDGVGEYRGEDLYDVVAANELKIGVTKNQDGGSVVGTYAATERYTDVPEDKVDNGLAYRYNSLVNNRLGESTGATVVLDVLTEALLESDDSGATIEAY